MLIIYQTRNDDLVTFATERSLEPTLYLRMSMLVLLAWDVETAIFASEITATLGLLVSVWCAITNSVTS